MSDAAPRVIAPEQAEQDAPEASIRPTTLDEFVGQRQLRDNLRVFIDAARSRREALDHVLFFGPPGLGKTTLAQIVARELAVGFRSTSGPVIQRAGDLAALLTNLQPRDILFIDEIHRLAPAVEEILYPAMEDFQLDLIIGEGPGARSIRIDLPPFTLVGATTRSGLITRPLRERFVGNIEGRDIHRGAADVVICDGFVGNVVLKLSEGVFDFVMKMTAKELMATLQRLGLRNATDVIGGFVAAGLRAPIPVGRLVAGEATRLLHGAPFETAGFLHDLR